MQPFEQSRFLLFSTVRFIHMEEALQNLRGNLQENHSVGGDREKSTKPPGYRPAACCDEDIRIRQTRKTTMMTTEYAAQEPTRAEIDALQGATVLEFGAPWCGHCQAAQPLLESALAEYPAIRHIKVEDGSGRPLGRSFKVKLWPSLIFLRDGLELARLVRPGDGDELRRALAVIAA